MLEEESSKKLINASREIEDLKKKTESYQVGFSPFCSSSPYSNRLTESCLVRIVLCFRAFGKLLCECVATNGCANNQLICKSRGS